MGKLSFDGVDVLIYDPVSANRTTTRAAMYSLGFRKTETVSTLEDFISALQNNPPDIGANHVRNSESVKTAPFASVGRTFRVE